MLEWDVVAGVRGLECRGLMSSKKFDIFFDEK